MNSMSRISLNIHGQNVPDVGALLAFLRAIRPAWVLVMDNLGLCKSIKADLPETNVIYRKWPDDDAALRFSPEAWVAERAKEAGDAGVWCYTTNEPAFDAHTIDWNARVLELAQKAGLKLVVGNWSVGKPVDVDNGWALADKLLRLLDAYRDTAVLGLHEYANAVITSGFIGGTPAERGLIMPETWPGDVDRLGALWHCGRFGFLLGHCRRAGIKPPRIVMTEHGFDDVSDIKAWTETLIKTPVEGNPGGNIRGWKTLRNQWAAWFPRWSHETAYFEQLKYADQKIYQGTPVEAQLIFSWGASGAAWNQFDISGATELQRLLIGYAGVAEAPTPAPVEPPAPVVVEPPHPGAAIAGTNRTGSAVIIRHIAGKPGGKQIGTIPPMAQYTYYPATAVEADGYTWVWLECGSERGWSALEALAIDDVPETPAGGAADDKLAAQVEALTARVAALEAGITKLNYILAAFNAAIEKQIVNGKE